MNSVSFLAAFVLVYASACLLCARSCQLAHIAPSEWLLIRLTGSYIGEPKARWYFVCNRNAYFMPLIPDGGELDCISAELPARPSLPVAA